MIYLTKKGKRIHIVVVFNLFFAFRIVFCLLRLLRVILRLHFLLTMASNLTLFLNSIELHNQVINRDSSVEFYVFVGVAFVLIYLKTTKNSFFKNLLSTIFSDSTYFDSLLQTGITSSGSVMLQLSFVILSGLGMGYLTSSESYFTVASAGKGMLFVLLMYVYQLIALYVFTVINFSKDTDFLRHRLAYNEFNALLLFVGLLLVFYLPFSTWYLNIAVFCLVWLVNMVGSSAYLLGNISVFHIILYLCILELIPVLFLLKYL